VESTIDLKWQIDLESHATCAFGAVQLFFHCGQVGALETVNTIGMHVCDAYLFSMFAIGVISQNVVDLV
jgi:hypothetical protein